MIWMVIVTALKVAATLIAAAVLFKFVDVCLEIIREIMRACLRIAEIHRDMFPEQYEKRETTIEGKEFM